MPEKLRTYGSGIKQYWSDFNNFFERTVTFVNGTEYRFVNTGEKKMTAVDSDDNTLYTITFNSNPPTYEHTETIDMVKSNIMVSDTIVGE